MVFFYFHKLDDQTNVLRAVSVWLNNLGHNSTAFIL
jgi:hypothetical protein